MQRTRHSLFWTFITFNFSPPHPILFPLLRPLTLSYIFPFTVRLIYISLGVPGFSFTFLAHLKVSVCTHRVSFVSSSPDSSTCAGSLEGRKVNCLSQLKESQNIVSFIPTVLTLLLQSNELLCDLQSQPVSAPKEEGVRKRENRK